MTTYRYDIDGILATYPPPRVAPTPNQIVAANLRRARTYRGLTQEQAAQQLAPHLGVRWSKATFSAAERSVDGKVIRQFTADDIVAFSRGFGFPVAYFFVDLKGGSDPT